MTNTYDATFLTDRTGLKEHDTANYGVNFLYRGNVTSSTRLGVSSSTNYDITGMPVTNTSGATVVAITPSNNNVVPATITPNSQSNLAITMSWTGFLGLSQEVDPNGATTTLVYDSYARPQQATSPHGAVTTFIYTNSPPTKKATTNNKWVKSTFDGLGRVIKTETGYSTTTVSIVDTEYDSCACSPGGKVTRVSQPRAPGGTVYWTTNTYDGLGRITSVAHPGGDGTTTYLYEGNTVKLTDPAGKWKKYTSDVFGNLTKVNEPRPGGGADYETNYTYNLHDPLTQVSMPRPTGTQTRTFNYDLATGRLTSATNPENGTVSYTYNSDGTIATKTDAKGDRQEWSYDTYKRVTQTRRFVNFGFGQFGEDACQAVNYYYDTNPLDGSFTQNGWGRLTAAAWTGGRRPSHLAVPCT
ncbi:MAG: hypothetical protein ACREBC_26330, partial [Pyrinomonadaceae bacterium]